MGVVTEPMSWVSSRVAKCHVITELMSRVTELVSWVTVLMSRGQCLGSRDIMSSTDHTVHVTIEYSLDDTHDMSSVMPVT